ncbi:PREDICTED: EKC/KEOPS complex subunit LAGE3-like [Ceratotherium simum simum]|uniref:EKC/KEOPS complex subunit LAGE3-like n=1 Tax=Ceratotherium simum simum TaxID=73337 RepID=A0ABM1C697_CERSS|nr:PREDICTED: EKC/KEOPS complex subunit LAGE3-like [Ceratotherium simum simum]
MQAADEGGSGAAGAGGGPSSPEGLGGPGGPNSHSLPSVLEGQGGPVSPSGPGGPSDQVSPGGPDSPSGQRGPGGPRGPNSQGGPGGPSGRGGSGLPDGQGGPGGPGSSGGEGTVGSAAIGAPDVARAAHASGPGGDAAPVDAGPESRQMVFTLTVPFRSPLEAEMARRAMAPDAQHHRQAVQKEFTVNGSVLAVRWTAEDPGLLQISINSFLDQLSLLVQNIRWFGPPPPLSLG